jgi:hypothetical protein
MTPMTTVVNHGVIAADKVWLKDLAAKEAAARDIAEDAPAIAPEEIAAHMDDIRTHNASHAAATAQNAPVTRSEFAQLALLISQQSKRIEAMEQTLTNAVNAAHLAQSRENATYASAAGQAVSGARQATREVANKTDSTNILDELQRQAGLKSRGTVRNALDGTDSAGNAFYPLRRIARDRALAQERTYLGREAITTDESFLRWMASPSEVAQRYMGRPGVAASPWMALRSVQNPAEYPILYRALLSEVGLAASAIDRYMVPFGQFDGDL